MNLKSLSIISAAAIMLAACDSNICSKTVKLSTEGDSASYAIGVLIGQNNKMNLDMSPGHDQLNFDILINAFAGQMQGKDAMISSEESQRIVQDFFENASKKVAQKNIDEETIFFETNSARQGVHFTESGLQYEIITLGDGAQPTAEQTVKVHYHGTLLDGTVFDSSVDRGQPATFGVSQVIPGWTEALQLMPVGSKWKIYIPSKLAYGERGAGREIGPNATLVFEVELLEIVK